MCGSECECACGAGLGFGFGSAETSVEKRRAAAMNILRLILILRLRLRLVIRCLLLSERDVLAIGGKTRVVYNRMDGKQSILVYELDEESV
jgi:hypothetical protein